MKTFLTLTELFIVLALIFVSFTFGRQSGIKSQVHNSAIECQHRVDAVQKEIMTKFYNLNAMKE